MKLLRLLGRIWDKPLTRKLLVLAILATTITVFSRFFVTHPQYWQQLKDIKLSTILVALAINGVLIVILAGIYRTSVQLAGKQMGVRENFLLTAYSSVINFFGPLQSGPGVRAVYLKSRLGVRLRDYTFVTLLYYGMFAVINIGFLFAGTLPWWLTSLALIAGSGFSLFVIRFFKQRDKQPGESQLALRGSLIGKLAVLTFMQIGVLCLLYFFELRSIDSSVNFSQAISYTGAADLALFVSITPGAIGFRESFLYFSQSLHHISTANILSANLIDRAVYVLFILILLVAVVALHADKKLRAKDPKRSSAKS